MSEVIMNVSNCPLPLARKSCIESSPAKGTPMKFTKSLPANAIAKAKVPSSTMILNTLTRSRWSISISTVEPTNVAAISIVVLASIQLRVASLM